LRILIIGAGGHGQVVADIIWCEICVGKDISIIGYLDNDPALQGQNINGIFVLGNLEDRTRIPHEAIIVAIGNNEIRMRLARSLLRETRKLAIACHPASVIGSGVPLGSGSMVCAGVVVNIGTSIGANVILNTGCTVDHHNRIGDYVHIGPGAHLGGEVTVEEGAFVGIGATIMPHRRVGRWSIVGAGAVVHKDVPDGVVVAGIPAKVIGSAKIPVYDIPSNCKLKIQ